MEKIVVNPIELAAASNKLSEDAATYKSIYTQLMDAATQMGSAWTGEDNQAFVAQISGFQNDFELMVQKLNDASSALKAMADTYTAAQENNISAVKGLAN